MTKVQREERTFLPGEGLVVNGAGVETMFGVAGEISNSEEPEDLLHGENREVVELPARVDQRSAFFSDVVERQIGEPRDALLVGDRTPVGSIEYARRNVYGKCRPLPQRRQLQLDATYGGAR